MIWTWGRLLENFYKNRYMIPINRPLPQKMEKTLLIVSGKSNTGKTLLSTFLLSDKCEYISMDAVVHSNTNIPKLEAFKFKFIKSISNKNFPFVDKFNHFINENCMELFISYLFKYYVDISDKNLLILDGHIFTYNSSMEYIAKLCRDRKIRIWIAKKYE
jgi:archaellum biogenesis ATPase FlaH